MTSEPTKIHASKQPRRPHFVREWAEKRNYGRVTDLAEALGVDKSLVSRWYKGTTPGDEYQEKLAALFFCEKESLFRHPDEDWLVRFFAGRKQDEIERMKAMLEAAFPKRKASSGNA